MAQTKTISDEQLQQMSRDELEAAVRHHNHRYWDLAAPEISDYDYDRLIRRLHKVAPDSTVPDELGPSVVGELGTTVTHAEPMLSLGKCYDYRDPDGGRGDLFSWAYIVRKGAAQGEAFAGDVVVTPKMDGIAASLRYDRDGRLYQVATRGNGRQGEDITVNAMTISDIPHKVELPAIEVRGEIYMKLSVFKGLSGKYSNPRNLAAGAIKHKDPKKCAAYKLSFAAYDLMGTDLQSEAAQFDTLVELGFAKMEYLVKPKEEIQQGYQYFADCRDALDFEIDGVVFKVNRVDEQERMGLTSHHPRFAIAYKFQGDVGTTTLEAVEWSVARSGAITPVARIKPVTLSGAVVSRASLHNLNIVEKQLGLLGRYPGAQVKVVRSGGVIPKVEEVVRHAEDVPAGTAPIAIPSECPSCGGEVVRSDDFLFCKNPKQCRAAVIGGLAHFCKVVDIQGFGDKLLNQCYDAKILRSPLDLYTLTAAKLVPLDRVGQKLADKLVADIAAHRKLPLDLFLRALGVDELARHVTRIVSETYGTLQRVRQLTAAELAAIHTIGDTIAQKVVDGLVEAAPLIDGLLEHVEVESFDVEAAAPTADGILSGQSFVFTGKMVSLQRKAAQKKVVELGGEAPSGVTRDLTYLVVGDGASKKSSKQTKAEKHNDKGATIQIISESDFAKLTEEEG